MALAAAIFVLADSFEREKFKFIFSAGDTLQYLAAVLRSSFVGNLCNRTFIFILK
jgi:hypothetical protein